MDDFDPNRPFEIVEDQDDFDPTRPFQVVEDEEMPGPTESLIRGAAQNATLGLADEAAGAGEALMKKLQGDQTPLTDLYRQGRDESRNLYKLAEQENPSSYLGGQVAGAIAPALLTGGASIGGLAAQGALQGLGSSEADLTKGELAGAARDTGIGGAIGAGAGFLGNQLSKLPIGQAVGYVGDKLKGGAEDLARLATGTTGLPEKAGRELLDQGIVKFGDTTGGIARRASAIAEDAPQASLVAPIKEAALKPGFNSKGDFGLDDLAVLGTTGVKGLIAKKVLAPRAMSSGAVIADNLADVLKASPQAFGKFAGPLQAAAQRGGTSLAATNFILQQTNPEYRQLVLGNQEDEFQ